MHLFDVVDDEMKGRLDDTKSLSLIPGEAVAFLGFVFGRELELGVSGNLRELPLVVDSWF